MKTSMQRDLLVKFAHALSDPTRTEILMHLRSRPGYPTELAESFSVPRQSISNHLTELRTSGLVDVIREGRRNRYELADKRLGPLLDNITGLMLTVGPLSAGKDR